MFVELLIVFTYPFDFCRVCSDIPILLLILVTCVFSFFFHSLTRDLWYFIDPVLCLIFSSVFNFINSCSYFFPSTFWVYLAPPAQVLEIEVYIINLRLYLFFIVSIQCHKFPFQHCFSCVAQNLTYCILFLFSLLYVFKFSLRLPLCPVDYLKVCCFVWHFIFLLLISQLIPLWTETYSV